MTGKRSLFIVLLCLVLAIAVPLLIRLLPFQNKTQEIPLEARKYGYSPSRIIVNRGDKIILKATSLDVTHGFLLDGYGVEAIIKQEGIVYEKITWEDDDGKLQVDWDRVPAIEFVADREGKFSFRCTQTCGNLHPFMTGELIVRPNTPFHLAVSLSISLSASLFLIFLYRPESQLRDIRRINLLERFSWLKKVVGLRSLQFLVILPNFIVFYLFVLSSLWGTPVGNRNIAIIFVWILWWFLLKAVFVPLGGRLWCFMCPLPAPAEWVSRRTLTGVRFVPEPFRGIHHRFTGLQLDWPKWTDNIWLQNFLFLALISSGIILITRPVATAFLFLSILLASILLALVYRNRVFCRYLCPVGGFLGTYSMASVTEIRAIDRETCKKHKEKSCLTGGPNGWACPWGQYVGNMKRNNYCGLCTECIKSCPKDNVGIFVRAFGSDRVLKGYDELFNAAMMLAVAILFSITMLGPWSFIKDAANVTETRAIVPFVVYLAFVWGLSLLILPGGFLLISRLSNGMAGGRGVNARALNLRLGYLFIPVGIFTWIAFSLPQLMVNYSYILNVLSDPMGFGWDLFGTANYPFKPFHPEWIPFIQGFLLLGGLYLSIRCTHAALEDIVPSARTRLKVLILPVLFMLVIVNLLLRLYMG
ncbi:MAG: 4Fe-4S binding protein [Deltaproteobacteria bacterium]|nr:4Fe-4S binding protein [Deltaproteobacteria bacterium]